MMLIVDDIAVFRETFINALHKRFPDIHITEAVNGAEALEKVRISKPELVFMDIKLPDENGISLTGKIKLEHPDITVVILTDHDLPEYREAAACAGADDFIQKGDLKMSTVDYLVKRYMTGDNSQAS
jgi:DNA-binding NarL/FixJ family response regulator